MVGLVCFDYSVLFSSPTGRAMDCYARLIQSFCVCGYLAKELKTPHMDNYLEFVDDLRFVFLDKLPIGPKIEDMVTFLLSSPELSNKESVRHTYSSYVACDWDTRCRVCPKSHWVHLVEVSGG